MPIRTHIDRAQGIVVFHCHGLVDDDHLVGAWERVFVDPEYEPGMNELVDVRGITELKVTPTGIERLIATVENMEVALPSRYRTAVVADQDAAFGMSRMYELLRRDGRENVRVFRRFEEAARWLGIPADEPSA